MRRIAACDATGSAGTTGASPKSTTRSSAIASTPVSSCGPGEPPAARIARGPNRVPGRSETSSSIGAPTMATSTPDELARVLGVGQAGEREQAGVVGLLAAVPAGGRVEHRAILPIAGRIPPVGGVRRCRTRSRLAAAAATVASVGSNSIVSGPGLRRGDVRHPRRGRAEADAAHVGRPVRAVAHTQVVCARGREPEPDAASVRPQHASRLRRLGGRQDRRRVRAARTPSSRAAAAPAAGPSGPTAGAAPR